MKTYAWTAIVLAAVLMAGSEAMAQQPPAAGQSPMDVVPEKMPFNTPYGTPISLAKAQAAVAAAVAEADKRGWQLNVAVLIPAAIRDLCTHGRSTACVHCHLRTQGAIAAENIAVPPRLSKKLCKKASIFS